MVAAAGETECIRPRMAVAGLAGVIAGLAMVFYAGLQVSGLRMMDLPLPPEVLTSKAQDIIKSLGYPDRPVDDAAQWYYYTDFTDYVHDHDQPRPNWPKVLSEPPLVLQYAYRQSPVYLDPDGYQGMSLTPGVVQFDDPPAIQSGMINMILDSQGRLTYFQQSPGAQLLFDVGKHRISVFIFQNRAELSTLNSGSSLSRKLAFNTETWSEGGLWYFVVGDASPSDVHDLGELLRSANR